MSRDSDFAITQDVYCANLEPENVQPGDVGVAHSKGIIGWLIRFGTRSNWNHAFIIERVDGTDPADIHVIQAEAHGVQRSTLDKVAPGGYYAILPCPKGVSRARVVDEAQSLLRAKYAYLTIASIALHIIAKFLHLPIRLAVRDRSTLICSAVVALSLLAGGWLHPWADLYEVTPAQIAVAVSTADRIPINP